MTFQINNRGRYKYLICVDGYHSDNQQKKEAEEFICNEPDSEAAAKKYVEQEHSAMDSPSECHVTVWDNKGIKSQWKITAELDIVFYSSEIT